MKINYGKIFQRGGIYQVQSSDARSMWLEQSEPGGEGETRGKTGQEARSHGGDFWASVMPLASIPSENVMGPLLAKEEHNLHINRPTAGTVLRLH